ncbi:hypothetical protein [Microbacterium sp.]|uniref:hypothetical protein n=1 Tax=Microbacterium sp. TaxID=51671 RepID=UPI002811F955|nr:hypothetical protein [Microbacterium sp.]
MPPADREFDADSRQAVDADIRAPEVLAPTPRRLRPWRSAWLWGIRLLAVAAPWYLSGAGLDLLPYLLTLAGGWAIGFALVSIGGAVVALMIASLNEVRMLRWRTDGGEARVEVETVALRLCLIAGIARTEKGAAAALPPLPRHVRRSLERAGLALEPGRRKGVSVCVELQRLT